MLIFNKKIEVTSQTQASHPLDTRRFSKIVNLSVLLLIMFVLPITVYLAGTRQDLRQFATGNTPVRGASGDLWADIVLGQPDFGQNIGKEKTQFKVAGPGGVLVDQSSTPQRVYVYDGMNSRVLGFSSLGICAQNPSQSCTSNADCGGNSCQLQVGGVNGNKKADLVLGQPNFSTGACNGDGTGLNLPTRIPASANFLCSQREGEHSPYEGGSFTQMATDLQGNLFVADFYNNRILEYYNPYSQDTQADQVWGQDNFNGNTCNKGQYSPSASSLCFDAIWGVAGVAIDSQGNLWVADNGNHRVLRYPKSFSGISKSADIVLGQTSFTSRNPTRTCGDDWDSKTCNSQNSGLQGLNNPVAVRVNTDGKVYVADAWNHRIVVYDSPRTGATARLFATGLQLPSGIEFDRINNGIWINNMDSMDRVILLGFDGSRMKVLGPKGLNESIQDNRSGVGITKDGDVLVGTSEGVQDVFYYRHPILPESTRHIARLFSPPYNHNYLSNRGFHSPRGIAVKNNQLIVADVDRLAYWNIPNGIADLTNYKPFDGIVGVQSFIPNPNSPQIGRMSADDQNNLWTIRLDRSIAHYTLPLSTGQLPDKIVKVADFKYLGSNSTIGQDFDLASIYAEKGGKYLWLAVATKNIVLRVRIPSGLQGDYIVDAMIGGSSIQSETWGFHDKERCWSRDQQLLCYPGAVVEDNFHNLYVSDMYLESHGSQRFFRFNSSVFPTNNSNLLVIYTNSAAQKFNNVAAWEPTFDSTNRMVSGLSFYHGMDFAGFNSHRHPIVIHDFLSKSGSTLTPDASIGDIYSQPYNSAFDQAGNLYIGDLNWGRVLVYKNPFNNAPPYSQVIGNLTSPGPATFSFQYSGTPTTNFIDISTKADMSVDVYINFGSSTGSTITVNDPTKWTEVYTCGKTLYWRVRQGDFYNPSLLSAIQTSTIACGPTPTPTQQQTPTKTPTPTMTKTPTPKATDTPTPTIQNVSYSSLYAIMHPTNMAQFGFSYTGPSATHHIDISTLSDMSWDVFMDFGQGTQSPVNVTNPTKWTGVYACGKTLYWRIRQGDYYKPTHLSVINATTVGCINPPSPTVTPTLTKTPTPSLAITPTPFQGYGYYSNLFSSMQYPNPATFNFSYSGSPTTHYVDVSLSSAMEPGTYLDFGTPGSSSPIYGKSAALLWPEYACGKTLYWWVRQGTFYDALKNQSPHSDIKQATVSCGTSPTKTPTPTPVTNSPSPTRTPTPVGPTPTPGGTQSVVLHAAAIGNNSQSLYVFYSQTSSIPTYITDANTNIILQGSTGFTNTSWSQENRPLSDFLGILRQGQIVKLCTGNLQYCSNSASILVDPILGVSDEKNSTDIITTIQITLSAVKNAFSEISEGTKGLLHNFNLETLRNISGTKKEDSAQMSSPPTVGQVQQMTRDLTDAIGKYDSNKNIPLYNYFLKSNVINIAKLRQSKLLTLINIDPLIIRKQVFPKNARAKAPVEAQKYIESINEITGIWRTTYNEMYATPEQIKSGVLNEPYIYTEDNNSYKVHFDSQSQVIPNETTITVRGFLIGNELLLTDPAQIQQQTLGAQTSITLKPATGNVLGTRNDGMTLTKKVYAIIFDPIINGQKMWQYYSWLDPDILLTKIQTGINENSNGRVNYVVTRKEEYPIYNQLKDGFTYNATTYQECKSNDSACRRYPGTPYYIMVDYQKILKDYGVCKKLNNGEIDELWLFGAPYFGYLEATTTGPNAFNTNGGPELNTEGCNRILHIMGFNYERDYDQALHSYGHRIEGTMRQVFGSWTDVPYSNPSYWNTVTTLYHDWDKYSLNNRVFQNFSYSGCGNTHYPPNGNVVGQWGYDYSNESPAQSTCEDYSNYPSLTDAKTDLTCQAWKCSHDGYQKWWFAHIPSFDGFGPNGKLNNWWRYIADSDTIFSLRPSPTSSPTKTPTPTPTQKNSYTGLNAILTFPGPAAFGFSYNGPAGTQHIDISTNATMSSDVYLNFAEDPGSPVTVSDPAKWTAYACGKTLYWWVRQGDYFHPTNASSIKATVVDCGTTPTPTPGTPSVTKTPTPAPTNPTTPYPTTISSYSGLGAILFYPDAAGFGFTYTGPEATHHIDASTIPDMSYNTYVDFGVGLRSPIMAPASSTSWPSFACNTTLYWRVRQGSFLNPTTLSLIQPTKVGCPITPTPTPTGIITPTLTKTPTPTQIISGPTATKTPTPTPPVGGTKTPTPGFTKTPTPTITKSPTPTPSISGPTATKTPTPLATRTPTPTNSPTPASIRTPTPTQPTGPTPTPTPPAGGTPSTYWTNLTGNLKYPGNATFSWTYNGPSGAPHIDVSTSSDLTQNFKPDFVIGAGSPTVLTNPASVWTSYNCNTDVYWRVRQGTLASPIRVSYVKKSTVTCPASPTPTLTKSPTPTITPTPTQQPSSLQQVVLHNARINSGNATLSITYTRLTTSPVYITDATSNTIIQENGYSGISPSTTEFRPLNTFLGPTLQQGKSIKLCTGNYSLCSNTSTIGQVQGVSDTRISLFRREIMTQLDESITGHLRSLSTQ